MEQEEDIQLILKLDALLSRPPLSLEILPGDQAEWASSFGIKDLTPEFPFLYIDGNLGVTKKLLYRLYLVALGLLKSPRSSSTPDLICACSCVILLANPAHQTALNSRKRIIQSGYRTPDKELEFIEVLLRTPGDYPKQSILWDHRRWTFGHIYTRLDPSPRTQLRNWATSADLQPFFDIPPDAVKKEFGIIRRACELYPRNYHAWTHWHLIADNVIAQFFLLDDFRRLFLEVLIFEYNDLRRWVDLHVSDYSAMYHLCTLDRLFHDLEYHVQDFSILHMMGPPLSEHALSLLESYPSHESLWLYLRETVVVLPTAERKRLLEYITNNPTLISDGRLVKEFIARTTTQVSRLST